MSAKLLLEDQSKRKALGAEKAGGRAPYSDVKPNAASKSGPIACEGEGHDAGGGLGGVEAEQREEATGEAGFVEFLPVGWFDEVRRLERLFSFRNRTVSCKATAFSTA